MTKQAQEHAAARASPSAARALLALQIGLRLLTFVLNQVLVRTTPPAVFGAANVQLELVLSTVLSLSRDGVRAIMMRHRESLRKHGATGMLHNLALWPVGLGGVLAVLVGWMYMAYLAPTDLWIEGGASVYLSVVLYCAGAWIELAAEPLHTYALGLDREYVTMRVAMEAGGVLTKSLVNVLLLQPACLAWMSRVLSPYIPLPPTPIPYALLAFALARLAYGCAVLAIAIAGVARICGSWRKALMTLAPVRAPWIDRPMFAFLRVTTGQALLKLLLTEGDKLAMARWTSLDDQGGYALASNYGSLFARTLFQPLEESSRLRFSRCVDEQQDAEQTAAAWADAAEFLGALLHMHMLFGLGLVALAPPISRPFLRIVAGARWTLPTSPAARILASYCWYVPVMGVNGLVEAFVQSVAPPAVLQTYSGVLMGSSGVLVGVLGLHKYVAMGLAPLGWGAESVIVVASMASLGVRAYASARYVVRAFEQRARSAPSLAAYRTSVSAVCPHVGVIAVLGGCAALLRLRLSLTSFGTCALLAMLCVWHWERVACVNAWRVLR